MISSERFTSVSRTDIDTNAIEPSMMVSFAGTSGSTRACSPASTQGRMFSVR